MPIHINYCTAKPLDAVLLCNKELVDALDFISKGQRGVRLVAHKDKDQQSWPGGSQLTLPT